MTLTLEMLRDNYVFESSPVRSDLAALHVPFDDLTRSHRTERRLAGAVRRGESAALIGVSGCGKSSVVAHVLGPAVGGVAPLVIPLAAMPANTIDSPAHLVDYLLRTVTRQASNVAAAIDIELSVATRIETESSARRSRVAAGWGWLKADLARELGRQTTIERSATVADKADALVQVLALITEDELQPVLVFDDTDRWLRNGGPTLMRGFFGEGVRWLLELPASLVVAVHPGYFAESPRQQLLQYVDTQIEVPNIPEPVHIAAILTRRIEVYADIGHADLRSIFAEDTVAAVYDVYRDTGSLRRAIQVCHSAVHEALDAGVTQLTAAHIRVATNAR